MKKLVVLTSAFVLATSSAWATGIEFVAEGANSEVQTCIDAASGNKSVLQIAEDKGVSVAALDRQIKCNGVAVSKFAKQFQTISKKEATLTTEKNYALNVTHANKDAQLCAIAASGDIAKLRRVTRAQGLTVKRFVKYNSCNNKSVTDFVNQYGGKKAVKELKEFI